MISKCFAVNKGIKKHSKSIEKAKKKKVARFKAQRHNNNQI